MLDFVMKHTKKGECPLAGNTIYMDKIFLMKYMPRFVDHLHYRLVDVSTVKELARYVRSDYLYVQCKVVWSFWVTVEGGWGIYAHTCMYVHTYALAVLKVCVT